jgi:hypothetical protein
VLVFTLSAFLHSGCLRWVAEVVTKDLPNAYRSNMQSRATRSLNVGTPDQMGFGMLTVVRGGFGVPFGGMWWERIFSYIRTEDSRTGLLHCKIS